MAEVRRTGRRRGGPDLRFLVTGRAVLALLFRLGLVGLPHAVIYRQPGWAPILALITFVMAGVGWWCARNGELLPVSLAEVAFLGGRDRPRVLASVLAPGEEATLKILVTGRIELDGPGVAVRVFRVLGSPCRDS